MACKIGEPIASYQEYLAKSVGKQWKCLPMTAEVKSWQDYLSRIYSYWLISPQINSCKQVTKCSQCDFTSPQESHVYEHFKIVHETQRKYKCDQCHWTFSLQDHLEVHILANHPKDKKCPHSEYSTDQMTLLSDHVTTEHVNAANQQCKTIQKEPHLMRPGLKTCPNCEYTSPYARHLIQHIKLVHEKLRDFKCLQCHWAFSLEGHLKRHVKAVHQKAKDKKCPHCDHVAFQVWNLKEHVRKKHGKIGTNGFL
jgi:hypothetical protein